MFVTPALLALAAPALPNLLSDPCSTKERSDGIGAEPRMLLVDLDGDQRKDLVLVRPGAPLAVLLAGPDGRFTEAAASLGLHELKGVRAALAADLDGDGDEDLVLACGEDVRVFENEAALFREVAPAFQGASASWLATLDLDNDTLPDLRIACERGDVLLRNAGKLMFDVGFRDAVLGSAATPGAGAAEMTVSSGAALTPGGAGGGAAAVTFSGACAGAITDTLLGDCIKASRLPTLGLLYPLSADFNVAPSGQVGIGTTTPAERLSVAGIVQSTSGGFRFPDSTVQTSAGTRQWSELLGVPAGLADGVDDDTTYAAGLGILLAGTSIGFDTGFGDARYWRTSQPLGGDLAGSITSPRVDGLQGRPVGNVPPTPGQTLKWSGSSWDPSADADTTYTAGAGLGLVGSTFSVSSSGITGAMLAFDPTGMARVSAGNVSVSGSNVGIGTVVPTNRLSVGGNANVSGNLGVGTTSPVHRLQATTSGERAIHGEATASSGATYGGYFESHSSGGTGAYGEGGTFGLAGTATGASGIGVFGLGASKGMDAASTASAGTTYGGYFQNSSAAGAGVLGSSSASTGVQGYTSSSSSLGVHGVNLSTTGASTGVKGEGGAYGVVGESAGVGLSGTGVGPIGSVGVFGQSNSASAGIGVIGQTNSINGTGVLGSAFGSALYAIHGTVQSPSGWAGYFEGGRSYFEGPVGVGTSGPSARLAINSVANEDGLRVQVNGSTKLRVHANGGTSIGLNAASVPVDGLFVNGDVGIGTTNPAFTLHVNGTAGKPGGGSWSVASDRRFKKNVRPLRGALDSLLAVEGVRYEYIDPESIHELPGDRTGVIAQQVETVFPEWVDEGQDGFKRVTFRGFEALTIEALRELRSESAAEVGRLRSENAQLRRQNVDLATRIAAIEALVARLQTEE